MCYVHTFPEPLRSVKFSHTNNLYFLILEEFRDRRNEKNRGDSNSKVSLAKCWQVTVDLPASGGKLSNEIRERFHVPKPPVYRLPITITTFLQLSDCNILSQHRTTTKKR